MPDAAGNIKGIALDGRAGETLEKVFGRPADPTTEYVTDGSPEAEADVMRARIEDAKGL